ncbi:MAG: FAD binding domain-containing protein [Chloroflexota bacterium]
MSIFKEYVKPKRIDEAVELLSTSPGETAIMAGGTDLLIDIRQGRHPEVDLLIDVSEIEEMTRVTVEDDHIFLGAAVTHKQITSTPLLQEHARCLVESCGMVGGPQIRNVATIGGNVAHALPAGEGTVALLTLDTDIQLASPGGTRWLALIDIFAGPGEVTYDREKNLITGFRFATIGEGEASAFQRVMRPQGVAIAILNMAVWVKMEGEAKVLDIRIAPGPAGPRPFRAHETEAYLKGKVLNAAHFSQACDILADEVSLRTSAHRATKEYRHKLLPVLFRGALEKAVSRSINRDFQLKGV